MPLHPVRLFARRCNQAAEVARPLARLADRPYLPDALVRRRATATQGGKFGSAAAAMSLEPSPSRPVAAGR
ncbi:MAG: hypothetical protein ABW063_15050 [Caulobacter sp.]